MLSRVLRFDVLMCGLTCSAESRLEQYLQHMTFGALSGALLASAVLPLDWDRAWQSWPVPCVIGAALGGLCVAVGGVVVRRVCRTASGGSGVFVTVGEQSEVLPSRHSD